MPFPKSQQADILWLEDMKIASEMEMINAFDFFLPGTFLHDAITGGLLPEIFRAGEILLPEFSPT